MESNYKNVKISKKHHELLKAYCNKNGLKIYKVIEKWVDANCKSSKKDLYDEG